jgi:DoxX-like family
MNSSEKRPGRAERIGQVCTVIMVVMAGIGGILNLAQFQFPLAQELGLPWFIGIVLGIAKVLGVLTFLTRRFPMLREWAYAGLTFELLGAAGCHILAGISVLHAGPALFDLSFVLASYFLWHRAPGRVRHSIPVAHTEREPLPA